MRSITNRCEGLKKNVINRLFVYKRSIMNTYEELKIRGP
jgi:hypothetical protein